MLLRLFRIFVLSSVLSTAPALAQPASLGFDVVTAMDVGEKYETYVDLSIEGMTDAGLIGGPHSSVKDVTKLQVEVRRHLLDQRMQVLTLLALTLEQKRTVGELQILKTLLEQGLTFEQLPGQVEFLLKSEIYAAMSAHALVVAMGSGGQ